MILRLGSAAPGGLLCALAPISCHGDAHSATSPTARTPPPAISAAMYLSPARISRRRSPHEFQGAGARADARCYHQLTILFTVNDAMLARAGRGRARYRRIYAFCRRATMSRILIITRVPRFTEGLADIIYDEKSRRPPPHKSPPAR